jgi:plastocyanin
MNEKRFAEGAIVIKVETYKWIKRVFSLSVFAVVGAIAGSGQQAGTMQNPGPKTPSIFIRMLPDRMEPAQVTIDPGPVIILVQNRSTAPNVTVALDQTGGSRLNSTSLQPSQHHSLQSYFLTPGTYVLSEANHPTWTCTITVKPGN